MKPKIVWIEDDLAIIKDVIQPLIDEGYQFTYFKTIDEATENMDEIREADLLLLDLIYPAGPNHVEFGYYPGIALLKKMRTELNIQTPVIVFTVVTNEQARTELDKLNVSQVINKPIRPSALKQVVEKALNL